MLSRAAEPVEPSSTTPETYMSTSPPPQLERGGVPGVGWSPVDSTTLPLGRITVAEPSGLCPPMSLIRCHMPVWIWPGLRVARRW